MNKKLFVFDMDGTLLNDDRTINDSSVYALNEAINKGHHVVIATGRNFCQLEKELKLFPKIEYVITINGGIITNLKKCETKIISKPIDHEIIQEIVSIAQKIKRELQWSNDKNFYRIYFGNDPKTEIDDQNFFIGGTKNPKYDNWDFVKQTLYNDPVLHIAIKAEKKYVLEYIPILREKFESRGMCTITETSKCYLDCDPLGVNKYNALKFIQNELNVSNDDTYAFGDSNNDFLMIKHVGNGVAMGNARSEVKEIAKYVIGDNNSNAIGDFVLGVINEK